MRIKDKDRVRALFGVGEVRSVEHSLVERIANAGALLEGHFRLQSGWHSQHFLRFGQLAFRQDHADSIADLCLAAMPEPSAGTVLLAVETAPRYLAEALGRKLDTSVALTKADADRRPTRRLVDPAALQRAESIVVVADVMNTGNSIEPLVQLAKARTPGSVHLLVFATLHPDGCDPLFEKLDVEGTCLMRAHWPTHHPDGCPLCDQGIELLPAYEFN